MRRFIMWLSVAGLVMVAVTVRASAYLLAPVVVSNEVGERFGAPGPHAVGFDRMTVASGGPLEALVWYPAAGGEGVPATYSSDVQLFDPVGRFSVGSWRGSAIGEAPTAETAGPYPVVVLSPGFAMSSSSYAWLGEHLASFGFFVVSPDHDEVLDPARLGVAGVGRAGDLRLVLDHLVRHGRFSAMVDVDRLAVVGHSLGGFAALAAGGARLDTDDFGRRCAAAYLQADPSSWLCDVLEPQVESMAEAAGLDAVPPGLWPSMGDHRVDAIVSMAGDAFLFGADGLAAIEVPTMVIGGTADTDAPFHWTSHLAYDHVSSDVRKMLVLPDAGHMIFANSCDVTRRLIEVAPNDFCFDEHWERGAAHRLVADRTTAFLQAALGGEVRAAGERSIPRHVEPRDVNNS